MTQLAALEAERPWTQGTVDLLAKNGLDIRNAVADGRIIVVLNIDACDETRNKEIFDQLSAKTKEMEKTLAGNLEWCRNDEGYNSQVWFEIAAAGTWADESKWPALQQSIVQGQDRLFEAIKPHLDLLSS